MNKDNVKGKMKDIAGRVERQAGEWTGDPKKQAEGAGAQIEGKVQKAWGDLKDAGRKAQDNARRGQDNRAQNEADIDRKKKEEEAA